MEYSPGVYDRAQRWEEYTDWPSMLLRCGPSFPSEHWTADKAIGYSCDSQCSSEVRPASSG